MVSVGDDRRRRVSGPRRVVTVLLIAAAGMVVLTGIAERFGRVPLASAFNDRAARQQAVPPAAAASTAARAILDRARPSVIQIKGFFGTNTAEAFHGTGFAVARGGVFITNWHVVSDAVLHPEKYRLEYRTSRGATGRLTVRAIDIRHDLALVDAHGFAPPPLTLRADVAIKGERAFAIGFPLDVGLTITEGVSNGRVEDSFEPRVHYSGALNAGMSGGPGLDTTGNVIGVNVAGYFLSQLVSFFVPAEQALALLARADRAPLDSRRAHDEVATQLRTHWETLLAALDAKLPTQKHHGYELPTKPAPFVECRAAGDPAPDRPLQIERITCDAKSSVYLGRNLHTGGLTFQHEVLTTRTLDAWRFAHHLQQAKARSHAYGSVRRLALFACTQQDVELNGFTANATVCLRAYRKLDGIYDLNARVVSKNGSRRGFVSTLNLTGVAPERGLAFVRAYLGAIRWHP
jgi:S1-C subfamily serine protease